MVYTLYRVGCSLRKLCKKCQALGRLGAPQEHSYSPAEKQSIWEAPEATPSHSIRYLSGAVGPWPGRAEQWGAGEHPCCSITGTEADGSGGLRAWDMARVEEAPGNARQGQSGLLVSPEPLRRSCTRQIKKHFNSQEFGSWLTPSSYWDFLLAFVASRT